MLPESVDYVKDDSADDIETLSQVIGRIKTAWSGFVFDSKARQEANTFAQSVYKSAVKSLGIDAYSERNIQRYIRAITIQNAELIKSLSSQHINAIADIIFQGVNAGTTPASIAEKIADYGVTRGRAMMIARDQLAKAFGGINRMHQENNGFHYFRWVCSEDQRVRPSHLAVAHHMTKYGKGVYKWDDLPIVDGEESYPTSPINCRCTAVPVADWEVEDFQKGKK